MAAMAAAMFAAGWASAMSSDIAAKFISVYCEFFGVFPLCVSIIILHSAEVGFDVAGWDEFGGNIRFFLFEIYDCQEDRDVSFVSYMKEPCVPIRLQATRTFRCDGKVHF